MAEFKVKLLTKQEYNESEHASTTVYITSDTQEIRLGYALLNAKSYDNRFIVNTTEIQEFSGVSFKAGLEIQSGTVILTNCSIDHGIVLLNGMLSAHCCTIASETDYAIHATRGIVQLHNCSILDNQHKKGLIYAGELVEIEVHNCAYKGVEPIRKDFDTEIIIDRVLKALDIENKSSLFGSIMANLVSTFHDKLNEIKVETINAKSKMITKDGGVMVGLLRAEQGVQLPPVAKIPDKPSYKAATEAQVWEVAKLFEQQEAPIQSIKRMFSNDQFQPPLGIPIVHKNGGGVADFERFAALLPEAKPRANYPDIKVIQNGTTLQMAHCVAFNYTNFINGIVPKLHDSAFITGEGCGILWRETMMSVIFFGILDKEFVVKRYTHTSTTPVKIL